MIKGLRGLLGLLSAALAAVPSAGAAPDRALEAIASEILAKESGYYQADPVVGFVHRPSQRIPTPWPEHPAGSIEVVINGQGFREDRPTKTRKAAGSLRILVTGDSHTDGVVPNRESFPNVLEAALERGTGAGKVEVINGGVGHYSFQNYGRFLKRHLSLRPDVFVVAVYSGNDFGEAAHYLELAEGRSSGKAYLSRLSQAERINGGAVWQALNQVVYFKSFPAMAGRARAFAQERLRELDRLCRQERIRLLVVLLPTKLDVEWDSDQERLDRVRDFLGLSDSDLGINASLREGLARWLTKEGIPHWDATADLIKVRGKAGLFWKHDYHLGTEGHRHLAYLLLERGPAEAEPWKPGRTAGSATGPTTSASWLATSGSSTSTACRGTAGSWTSGRGSATSSSFLRPAVFATSRASSPTGPCWVWPGISR
ncbi:MAG: hypothetical protein WC943_01910 [Elusimicrobiota bacterium]|jgi:lysophospholipase L1-like esterase